MSNTAIRDTDDIDAAARDLAAFFTAPGAYRVDSRSIGGTEASEKFSGVSQYLLQTPTDVSSTPLYLSSPADTRSKPASDAGISGSSTGMLSRYEKALEMQRERQRRSRAQARIDNKRTEQPSTASYDPSQYNPLPMEQLRVSHHGVSPNTASGAPSISSIERASPDTAGSSPVVPSSQTPSPTPAPRRTKRVSFASPQSPVSSSPAPLPPCQQSGPMSQQHSTSLDPVLLSSQPAPVPARTDGVQTAPPSTQTIPDEPTSIATMLKGTASTTISPTPTPTPPLALTSIPFTDPVTHSATESVTAPSTGWYAAPAYPTTTITAPASGSISASAQLVAALSRPRHTQAAPHTTRTPSNVLTSPPAEVAAHTRATALPSSPSTAASATPTETLSSVISTAATQTITSHSAASAIGALTSAPAPAAACAPPSVPLAVSSASTAVAASAASLFTVPAPRVVAVDVHAGAAVPLSSTPTLSHPKRTHSLTTASTTSTAASTVTSRGPSTYPSHSSDARAPAPRTSGRTAAQPNTPAGDLPVDAAPMRARARAAPAVNAAALALLAPTTPADAPTAAAAATATPSRESPVAAPSTISAAPLPRQASLSLQQSLSPQQTSPSPPTPVNGRTRPLPVTTPPPAPTSSSAAVLPAASHTPAHTTTHATTHAMSLPLAAPITVPSTSSLPISTAPALPTTISLPVSMPLPKLRLSAPPATRQAAPTADTAHPAAAALNVDTALRANTASNVDTAPNADNTPNMDTTGRYDSALTDKAAPDVVTVHNAAVTPQTMATVHPTAGVAPTATDSTSPTTSNTLQTTSTPHFTAATCTTDAPASPSRMASLSDTAQIPTLMPVSITDTDTASGDIIAHKPTTTAITANSNANTTSTTSAVSATSPASMSTSTTTAVPTAQTPASKPSRGPSAGARVAAQPRRAGSAASHAPTIQTATTHTSSAQVPLPRKAPLPRAARRSARPKLSRAASASSTNTNDDGSADAGAGVIAPPDSSSLCDNNGFNADTSAGAPASPHDDMSSSGDVNVCGNNSVIAAATPCNDSNADEGGSMSEHTDLDEQGKGGARPTVDDDVHGVPDTNAGTDPSVSPLTLSMLLGSAASPLSRTASARAMPASTPTHSLIPNPPSTSTVSTSTSHSTSSCTTTSLASLVSIATQPSARASPPSRQPSTASVHAAPFAAGTPLTITPVEQRLDSQLQRVTSRNADQLRALQRRVSARTPGPAGATSPASMSLTAEATQAAEALREKEARLQAKERALARREAELKRQERALREQARTLAVQEDGSQKKNMRASVTDSTGVSVTSRSRTHSGSRARIIDRTRANKRAHAGRPGANLQALIPELERRRWERYDAETMRLKKELALLLAEHERSKRAEKEPRRRRGAREQMLAAELEALEAEERALREALSGGSGAIDGEGEEVVDSVSRSGGVREEEEGVCASPRGGEATRVLHALAKQVQEELGVSAAEAMAIATEAMRDGKETNTAAGSAADDIAATAAATTNAAAEAATGTTVLNAEATNASVLLEENPTEDSTTQLATLLAAREAELASLRAEYEAERAEIAAMEAAEQEAMMLLQEAETVANAEKEVALEAAAARLVEEAVELEMEEQALRAVVEGGLLDESAWGDAEDDSQSAGQGDDGAGDKGALVAAVAESERLATLLTQREQELASYRASLEQDESRALGELAVLLDAPSDSSTPLSELLCAREAALHAEVHAMESELAARIAEVAAIEEEYRRMEQEEAELRQKLAENGFAEIETETDA